MKLDVFVIGNQEKDFLKKRQVAMSQSKADLVMFLNTDIKISGYRQSLKLFEDPRLFALTFSLESSKKGRLRRVELANGGSSIYRRKIWSEIGGINMIFEPYWFDDVDYSRRALDAGDYILEDGRVEVEQVGEMGVDLIKKTLRGRLIYWRNFFIYLQIHDLRQARRQRLNPFYWPFRLWAWRRCRSFKEKMAN